MSYLSPGHVSHCMEISVPLGIAFQFLTAPVAFTAFPETRCTALFQSSFSSPFPVPSESQLQKLQREIQVCAVHSIHLLFLSLRA